MKVSKWGNSLAVRLPLEVVQRLGIKEGDDLVFSPDYMPDALRIERKRTIEEMLERLKQAKTEFHVPEDFKFDREEANSRGR